MNSAFAEKDARAKYEYFQMQRHVNGKSDNTISGEERMLAKFEKFAKLKSFTRFNRNVAIAFKEYLFEQELSHSTILRHMEVCKTFFSWLQSQPGYKRALKADDAQYFSLTEKEKRAATSIPPCKFPTLRDVLLAVRTMPSSTAIEKRNRAMIALVGITGIRISALISLQLKHLDIDERLVTQDPREVDTKASKLIQTYFVPVSDELEAIVIEWVNYLRDECGFSGPDPLFPKTAQKQGDLFEFEVDGLTREFWATAESARDVFAEAFSNAGLDIYPPHTFRKMLVSEMYRKELSIAEFKALSQNLGHSSAQTTLTSYGTLSQLEQKELVRGSVKAESVEEKLSKEELLALLRDLLEDDVEEDDV
jgi:site-specific recombinase XerD